MAINQLAIATPIILHENMTADELRWEWERMMTRSLANEKLISGEISQDEWEQILDACGVDVIQLDQDWSEGRFYL